MQELYNKVRSRIINHELCVKDSRPMDYLFKIKDSFCISSSSVRSNCIVFVLAKDAKSDFPIDLIQMFFNLNRKYKMQFGLNAGKQINGCIYLIHREEEDFDLQEVYDSIYQL